MSEQCPLDPKLTPKPMCEFGGTICLTGCALLKDRDHQMSHGHLGSTERDPADMRDYDEKVIHMAVKVHCADPENVKRHIENAGQ